MAKAYFIGGAPRTGKTNLTLSVLRDQPMLAASTDALRYTLRQVVPREKYPQLFHLDDMSANFDEYMSRLIERTDLSIQMQNDESLIVWKSVVDFVKSNILDGFDVLIEGVAVLPEYLESLDFSYSAVFLGNQSDAHYQTTLESARSNKHDWLHPFDDTTIRAFSIFNQKFSHYLQVECEKYSQTYIEISDSDYMSTLDDAKAVLFS